MSAAEKLVPPPAPQPVKCRVPHRGDVIPIDTLTLDSSMPSTIPGQLSATIRAGKKGSRVLYRSILFVPGLRVFQIECEHPNGDEETVFVPERLAIQWKAEGVE